MTSPSEVAIKKRRKPRIDPEKRELVKLWAERMRRIREKKRQESKSDG